MGNQPFWRPRTVLVLILVLCLGMGLGGCKTARDCCFRMEQRAERFLDDHDLIRHTLAFVVVSAIVAAVLYVWLTDDDDPPPGFAVPLGPLPPPPNGSPP